MPINERFNISRHNGLTFEQALVAALDVFELVDRKILNALVLTCYPAHRVRFFKN